MFLSCLMLPLGAQAQVDIPQTITIAGEIEAFGATATSTLTVEVAMFDVATGGTALWNEEVLVTPNQGYVELELGSVSPLGPAFEGGATHIEIKIGDETLSPRLPISALPYAHQAGNSNRLEGKTLAEIKSEVSAEQANLSELLARIDELEQKVAALEAKTQPLDYNGATKTLSVVDANLAVNNGTGTTTPGGPATESGTGTGNLVIGYTDPAAIQQASHNVVLGSGHTRIQGHNHIISGELHNVTGRGNVVLGGSENKVSGHSNFFSACQSCTANDSDNITAMNSMNVIFEESGSNNFVVQSSPLISGAFTRFTGANNLVLKSAFNALGGSRTTLISSYDITVAESAVGALSFGGMNNSLVGPRAIAIGGQGNTINGPYSLGVGGENNTILGESSLILAGDNNRTSTDSTTILAGRSNNASGLSSVMIGGQNNKAQGNKTITINGSNNVADGIASMLIGGDGNQCLELASDALILGGSNTTCTRQNCSMFTRENATDAP